MSYRITLFALLFLACGAPVVEHPQADSESLGECLTRTGVRLYGASWCPHCHDQLALFGADAAKVPYIDCDPDADLTMEPVCVAEGFDFDSIYPMWIFPDLGRLPGVRSLDVIAKIAGCPSP